MIIYPSDDSYISGWVPDLNFGSEEYIIVGPKYRAYYKFDLSKIPRRRNIISATLALYCNTALTGTAPAGAHYLHNDDWDESTITWNNAPTDFDETAVVNIIPPGGDRFWIVTNDVTDSFSTDGIYSVVMKIEGSYPGTWFSFRSKDFSYAADWPFLEIIFEGQKYEGGTGTPEDPYLIFTAEQLRQMGDNYEDWDKNFKLMRDIDLSPYTGIEFHMIGTRIEAPYLPFTGYFNGNSHVISNFTFILPSGIDFGPVGLFGFVGEDGIISDLGLENPHTYSSSADVGSLAGLFEGGSAKRCWAKNVDIVGDALVGGLIGLIYEGTLSDSYVTGGQVSIITGWGGGLSGGIWNSTIERCYCTPYANGGVGLVAYNNGGTVIASFWDRETSGIAYSNGGIDKSTAEMKTKSTFTNSGWDFATPVWTIWEGHSYPKLSWEGLIMGTLAADSNWMYQNLPGQTNSRIPVSINEIYDPCENSSYAYYWFFELPDDVNIEPITVAGEDVNDNFWTFAAPDCSDANGLSDSGKTFKIIVEIVGNDFGNYGVAEREFAITLLGDVDNNTVVNVADRSIINTFWKTGAAGQFTFKDCDLNCDGVVNVADRSIANSIWRGAVGSNHVSQPCPLR